MYCPQYLCQCCLLIIFIYANEMSFVMSISNFVSSAGREILLKVVDTNKLYHLIVLSVPQMKVIIEKPLNKFK